MTVYLNLYIYSIFVNAGEIIIAGGDGKNTNSPHLYCITKSTGNMKAAGNTRNTSYPPDNGEISLWYH